MFNTELTSPKFDMETSVINSVFVPDCQASTVLGPQTFSQLTIWSARCLFTKQAKLLPSFLKPKQARNSRWCAHQTLSISYQNNIFFRSRSSNMSALTESFILYSSRSYSETSRFDINFIQDFIKCEMSVVSSISNTALRCITFVTSIQPRKGDSADAVPLPSRPE